MTEPADHLCAIGNRPHPAEAGLLCRGHYGKLADTIRDIVIETEQLSAVPSMAITNGGKGANLASHRAPARLDVLVLVDHRKGNPGMSARSRDDWAAYDDTPQVLDTLGSWARVVREERGLTTTGAAYVTTEADLLTKHLGWIAEQAWVDEAYDELRKLLSTLKRVNGDPDDKPIGRCYLPQHDGTCNGPIWEDTVAGEAHCGRCGERWSGSRIAHLHMALQEQLRPVTEDGRQMLTRQQMQELSGATRTKVNVWIHRARKAGHKDRNGHWDPQLVIPAQKELAAS